MSFSYHKIGTIATFATLFVACGDTGGTLVATCNESAPACPAGAYEQCEPTATPTTCCGPADAPQSACKVASGILTHTCPMCSAADDLCAVAADGTVDCDPFGLYADAGTACPYKDLSKCDGGAK